MSCTCRCRSCHRCGRPLPCQKQNSTIPHRCDGLKSSVLNWEPCGLYADWAYFLLTGANWVHRPEVLHFGANRLDSAGHLRQTKHVWNSDSPASAEGRERHPYFLGVKHSQYHQVGNGHKCSDFNSFCTGNFVVEYDDSSRVDAEEFTKSFLLCRHMLSADTKEDRLVWCDRLNEALANVRSWSPEALRPIKVQAVEDPSKPLGGNKYQQMTNI